MKIIKYLALLGFLSFFVLSCEREPRPADKIQKLIDKRLPVDGVYEFQQEPTVKLPVVFKEASYRGFKEYYHNNVIKVFQNKNGDIYKAVLAISKANGKEKQYKTLFIRNIEEESVDIHQDYSFNTLKEAIDCRYPVSENEVYQTTEEKDNTSFGWVNVIRSKDQKEPPGEPVKPVPDPDDPDEPIEEIKWEDLNGTFHSKIAVSEGGGKIEYIFKIEKDGEMFILKEPNKEDAMAYLKLNREFSDKKKGLLVYKITEGVAYYTSLKDQYLTLYVKNISADMKKAEFAIATKNESTSITKPGALGQTLEEAKAIKPPAASKKWGENMMSYAHQWIKTTKKE